MSREMLDYRTKMIELVRAFDRWAWKDAMENPADWENCSFDKYFEMFIDFVKTEAQED